MNPTMIILDIIRGRLFVGIISKMLKAEIPNRNVVWRRSFDIIVPDGDHAILENFKYDTVNYFGFRRYGLISWITR